MQYSVFLDIETIPTQSQTVIERMRGDLSPPKTIKKEESIKAWWENEADALLHEKVAKTSFDPAHGHICAVGWAVDGADPICEVASEVSQEADIIRAFFNSIRPNHSHTFIGHFIAGFDLRFILCRAVALGIPIPREIPRDLKPWSVNIFDTMAAWSGARETISLDNLCRALGIEGKGGFDGSMVAQAWANGEHQKIADYCKDDVIRVRMIWDMFQVANW